VSHGSHFEADIDLSCQPPPSSPEGAVLVQVRTHRRHCNTVPRKIFGSWGGSLLPTGETPVPGTPPIPPLLTLNHYSETRGAEEGWIWGFQNQVQSDDLFQFCQTFGEGSPTTSGSRLEELSGWNRGRL